MRATYTLALLGLLAGCQTTLHDNPMTMLTATPTAIWEAKEAERQAQEGLVVEGGEPSRIERVLMDQWGGDDG